MLRRRTPEHEAGRLLTAIYREHSAGAYRFAYHLTRSREDADDLVQVAFLGLHRALVRGDAIVSPAAWLSTTIKRAAINLAVKRRERPSSDRLDDAAADAHHGDGSAAEAAEDLARVQMLLYTLPEAQHHAFVLRHWSGLPNREIAEVLATTESAVESLLVRARAALLAAGSSDEACASVCSRLAADQPLAPGQVAHLSACRGCRTAEQRLARAAGVAAVAALAPNLHVAHALAATVPGFSAGIATGASGSLAAAAGTKAGAVGVLAKTGAAVVAVTAAAAIGVHAHLGQLHPPHAPPPPKRLHSGRAAPSQMTGAAAAVAPSTTPALEPVATPAAHHAADHHADGSAGERSGGSGDAPSHASGDAGAPAAQDGGDAQDGTQGGDTRTGTSGSGGGGDGSGSGGGGGSGGGDASGSSGGGDGGRGGPADTSGSGTGGGGSD